MYNSEVPKCPLNYGFGLKQSDIFGVQGLLRNEGSSYDNHSAIKIENHKVEFSAVNKQNEDLR
ncbi:DNA-directed RNA polymerase subunit alpha [Bienertia sinuspersici]